MNLNERHRGFESLEAFLAHHREQAERGNECSIDILNTHSRIDLARKARQAAESEGK